MRTMFRYEIPVDDSWHTLTLRGPIRHVASRDASVVEVWAENEPAQEATTETFRVVGTGDVWPEDDSVTTVEWAATTLAPHGLVWHLLRLMERSPLPQGPEMMPCADESGVSR